MKQRWSVLGKAAWLAYATYAQRGEANYSGMAKHIYTDIYRKCFRDLAFSKENAENQNGWTTYVSDSVGSQRSQGKKVTAQIQTQNGNEWVDERDSRIHDKPPISIVHDLSSAETRARIQVIVRPEYCGQPLYAALLVLKLEGSPITQFKVMNPKVGSEGPDSAVFYLGAALSDAGVMGLVSDLAGGLNSMCEPLKEAPWGLQELRPGIYGIDVPTNAQQRNILQMTRDFDSAGNILSHLVAVAAARTWQKRALELEAVAAVRTRQKSSQLHKEDAYVAYVALYNELAKICLEINWVLVA
jgi:hypothetical protein